MEADASQARVAGLPERVRLITLGGGFVEPDERVTPVPADRGPTERGPTERGPTDRAINDEASP